jgi:uncharacterized protein YoxC
MDQTHTYIVVLLTIIAVTIFIGVVYIYNLAKEIKRDVGKISDEVRIVRSDVGGTIVSLTKKIPSALRGMVSRS